MAEADEKPEVCLGDSDVSEASGYTLEKRRKERFANGWGGTQTKLPVGHLARRDTEPKLKSGSGE